MNKVKMLVVALVAAMAVGTGALVATPYASALPRQCAQEMSDYYYYSGQADWAYAHGQTALGNMMSAYAQEALHDWRICVRGG